MQFYILMIDFGKGPHGPMGYGADVQPEFTRQNIVDQVRNVLKEDRNEIAFVKFVDEGRASEADFIEDVTAEIIAEASAPFDVMATIDPDFSDTFAADRIAFNRDRARDYAKETV